MILLLLVGLGIFLIFHFIKPYRLHTYDTVVAFTGGLGCGKSLLSSEIAVKLLKKQRRIVFFQNLFRKKMNKLPKPLLYSSIPMKIDKKEMAVQLTADHLLLQKQIVLHSVVFLDEIGGFCSQFDYRVKNSELFDEFVRFFRHYVQGYLVVNDQCSENIVLQVRRRLNTVYNLMGFRKWFGLFYTVHCRNITVSEEIKTIEEQNTEDNMRLLFGILPRFKRFDSHCYYSRYKYVPLDNPIHYTDSMTQEHIMRIDDSTGKSIDFRINQTKKSL